MTISEKLTRHHYLVLSPLFGQTYQRAKIANTKEEFIRSQEASGAAVAWGTSLVGSALQAYGVGALINATGTLSYKGAAYLGSLIFLATSAPTVSITDPQSCLEWFLLTMLPLHQLLCHGTWCVDKIQTES